jgi:hypothetical protein
MDSDSLGDIEEGLGRAQARFVQEAFLLNDLESEGESDIEMYEVDTRRSVKTKFSVENETRNESGRRSGASGEKVESLLEGSYELENETVSSSSESQAEESNVTTADCEKA